jgi:D-xylose 1-dehydrogenase
MSEAIARYPSLAGKVALVTGGATGIGAAIVRAFVGQGTRVGFLDFDRAAGTALAATLGQAAHFEAVDLRDLAALAEAVGRVRAALGPIDILVNNAARDDRHALSEVTPAYWRERFATNLDHQFFAAQAVCDDMAARGGGSIINMGSTSYLVSEDSFVAYKTAKSAVVGLTRALARELGPRGIRVNSVVPGWIMTERQVSLWLTPEGEKELLRRQCLKRKLTPEDVTPLVLFFAAEESRAVTGQSWQVDGGLV